jgi:hypothetical protein
MLYAKINPETKEVLEWPLPESVIRTRLSNMSLPWNLDSNSLPPEYIGVPPRILSMPQETKTHRVVLSKPVWDEEAQVWLRDYELEEITEPGIAASRLAAKWVDVRKRRQRLFDYSNNLVMRALREERLGVAPTVTIAALDEYLTQLADITNADDPFTITWPIMPGANIS